MEVRELRTAGAYLFVPRSPHDARGRAPSPYREAAFRAATGGPLFPVRQADRSRARRGTVRGVRFVRVPPGAAAYVHCSLGRALYMVVDVRVGSPTFGAWESLVLDAAYPSGVYVPAGVGRACVALEDTALTCLLSAECAAADEGTVSVHDPDLGLPVPGDAGLVVSGRDRGAMTLDEARRRGLLPGYEAALAVERSLREAAARAVSGPAPPPDDTRG